MVRKIEVSHKTIIFSVLFLLLLWFLFFIRDIIFAFFAALFLMAILNPMVTKLSKIKIPRSVSIIVTYIVVFGLFGLVIVSIVPPLVEQTTNFANSLPLNLKKLGIFTYFEGDVAKELITRLGGIPAQIIKAGVSIFSNVVSVLVVLVFTFYLLQSRDKLDVQLGIFFGEEKRKELGKIIDKLEVKLGGWTRAEISLMTLVGIITYIGLVLLGIPYALPLALLAGLLEIVPVLGPFLAAIPSIIIGLSISPVMGLAVAALAFLVQQLENYVFIPKIMQKSTGVSPIITLLALAIGAKLAGVFGILFAVPVVITLQVLLTEHFNLKS
ncbi:MAG: AI-2E family transporter [bacterium]|nr:AI-2E family transporter [bacterium]